MYKNRIKLFKKFSRRRTYLNISEIIIWYEMVNVKSLSSIHQVGISAGMRGWV